MSFERKVRVAAACALVLNACAGSIPDEPPNGSEEQWEGETATAGEADDEVLRLSVGRVAGKLTIGFKFCDDDSVDWSYALPIRQIAISEASGQFRERCLAIAKGGAHPERISSWTYGSATTFDVKRCEPLETDREYVVNVEASIGCFAPLGSKRFKIGADGSISMLGKSCAHPYDGPRPEAPPEAPN